QVYLRELLEEPLPLLLRDATRHSNHHVRPGALQHSEATDFAAQLVLGFVANAAGIEQDHLGSIEVFDLPVSRALQHLRHAVGIVLVHLATEANNREVLHEFELRIDPGASDNLSCSPLIKRLT